jgi:hypothetical protein
MTLSQSKKAYLNFLIIIVVLLVTDYISGSDILYGPFHLNSLFTSVFCPILIMWGFSVRNRIIMPHVRHCLVGIAFSLLMLFVLRTCRHEFFYLSPEINIFLWCMYYIPFVTVPTLSFHAAVRTGSDPESKPHVCIPVIWSLSLILIISLLTNNLHEQLLIINDDYSYSHGWLYYVFLIYSFILTITSLVILFRKCQLSLCRKHVYMPVSLCLIGIILLTVYLVKGGSPELFGVKLYLMQEVFSLIFIGFWEGCIIIGLLPSNTHYKDLFGISHTDAELISSDKSMHFDSVRTPEQGQDEDIIQKEYPINGGVVRWMEDVKTVRDLIEEENRIMEEYTRYETLNRLYDSIADHTRDKVTVLDGALSDKDSFEKNIIPNLLLGTYVKRCANLILLSGSSKMISVEELTLSIRETFEDLSITGTDCVLEKGTQGKASAESVIAAFDLFESVAEKVLFKCSVISASITPAPGILLQIETDASYSEEDIPDKISKFRSNVTVSGDEDEVCIKFGGELYD